MLRRPYYSVYSFVVAALKSRQSLLMFWDPKVHHLIRTRSTEIYPELLEPNLNFHVAFLSGINFP